MNAAPEQKPPVRPLRAALLAAVNGHPITRDEALDLLLTWDEMERFKAGKP